MKGSNTLEINQATMTAALQLWADATFKEPVKMVSVAQGESRGRGHGMNSGTVFHVELEEPKPGQ